jgi:hypothetical protein
MGKPWKLCKRQLEDDIVHQLIPDEWEPERVHSFRAIYMVVDTIRFKANLATLRNKCAKELNRAILDDHAFQHDASLVVAVARGGVDDSSTSQEHRSNKTLRWEGSAAKRLLKQDMDDQQLMDMKPATLQATRAAYGAFDPLVFRKHVHQEKRSRKESPYWAKRKEKKDKKKNKNKKEDSVKKHDECEAFLRSQYQE